MFEPYRMQRLCGLLLLGVLLFGLTNTANANDEKDRWSQLRRAYFGDSPIVVGDTVVSLQAPMRAVDAATVPISIVAVDRSRQIRDVYLFVEKNPLPLAGIFRFTEAAGIWYSLETRVRINEYTHVRAIAVMANDELHMSERFVKASGGCSAPALSDMDAAMARAGKMKLLLADSSEATDPPYSQAVIKISHPNNSGMQFDQISRNYIPAFFVKNIQAEIDGVRLLEIETNFSMSENPVVRLAFEPESGAKTLTVVAVDSKGNQYEESAVMNTP